MPDPQTPASIDTERAVLGSILLDTKSLYEARGTLRPADFYLDSHRRIYAAAITLADQDSAVDLVTVLAILDQRHEVSAVGGAAYLAGLTEGLPRTSTIAPYIGILKQMSARRDIIRICSIASTRAADQTDADAVIGGLQDGIQAILDDAPADEPLVSAYTVAALDKYHEDRKLQRSPGLSYGVASVDEFTGGMLPGEVTIVGARSGVGKTSLMCQAAAANCQAGIPCHLFSLEMTREQILRRLWAIVSGVPYKCISQPWLSSTLEADKVLDAAQTVAAWPLRIHDQAELNLSRIVGLARVSMHRHGTRFVAVDYAQEVDAEAVDERMKVVTVSRTLARMVKHENASLMLLSQLVKMNRESYNKAPMVGDLVESGKLENVAHAILLLHRGWDEESGRISNEAAIIIPKQRRGETGVLHSIFDRRSVTFT